MNLHISAFHLYTTMHELANVTALLLFICLLSLVSTAMQLEKTFQQSAVIQSLVKLIEHMIYSR